MAARAEVSRLVLVHSNARLDDDDAKNRAIAHAQEAYSGELTLAPELSSNWRRQTAKTTSASERESAQ
jgi:ribonuclease BN (tRNA processing enzyme)